MSPSVAEAYSQLTHFHDLLLLEDLSSVTQDMKPHSMIQAAHTLSSPGTVIILLLYI